MSVTTEVESFIADSLSRNNENLIAQVSTMVTDSINQLKRSNSESTEEQMGEIKRLRKTVKEYTKHELADDEKDEQKIRQAEERAEKAVKSLSNKKFRKSPNFLPSSNAYTNARVSHHMPLQTAPS